MTARIVLSIPTIDGHVSGWTHMSVLGLPPAGFVKRMRASGVTDPDLLSIEALDTWMWDYDLVRVRSRAVRKFLTETDGTHLLFVDSDVSFEPATIRTLVALDLPIVALPYPKRDIHWGRVYEAARAGKNPEAAAYEYVVRSEKETVDARGILDVKGVGMGCTLLRRDMLEEMTFAYKDELEAWDNHDTEGGPTVMLFAMRWDTLKGKRHLYGEDISFCTRWLDMGGKIAMYVGPGSPAHHHGPWRFRGSLEGFKLEAEREKP
jgi:hypothetical protein